MINVRKYIELQIYYMGTNNKGFVYLDYLVL